jgi:hypothetical protein
MKNENMPANPQSFSMSEEDCGTTITHLSDADAKESMGETKQEKAFWQVYSALIACPIYGGWCIFDEPAELALKAVNAGFKALSENKQ